MADQPGSKFQPPVPSAAPEAVKGGRRRIVYEKANARWTFEWSAGDEPVLHETIDRIVRDGNADFDLSDASTVRRHMSAEPTCTATAFQAPA